MPGPDLATPFSVLSGLVVVMGEVPLNIPQGGTWPGLNALSPALLDLACPYETRSAPGTLTTPYVTPERLEAGAALVTAQLLCRGTVNDRLLTLTTLCDPQLLHHQTGAAVINVQRRERFTKALRVSRDTGQPTTAISRAS